MSKIVDLILKGNKYKLTSKFGSRTPISTKAGNSSNYHKGCDYGTYSKKVPVYAIENGTVDSFGKASDGALYVIIKYPRLNKLFRHWHLSSYCVKKGQSVSKGTKIGVTGMTGKATGIHLHLGIVDIATSCYIDPEEYAKTYSEDTNDTSDTSSKTYPYEITIPKGTTLYNKDGVKYKNPCSQARTVTVQGKYNGMLEIYGETFNPHVVYCYENESQKTYPYNAVIKKGSKLYNENGVAYKNGCSKDRNIKVYGEVNGRLKIYGDTFNPHIVYCDINSIK